MAALTKKMIKMIRYKDALTCGGSVAVEFVLFKGLDDGGLHLLWHHQVAKHRRVTCHTHNMMKYGRDYTTVCVQSHTGW